MEEKRIIALHACRALMVQVLFISTYFREVRVRALEKMEGKGREGGAGIHISQRRE